MPTVNATRMPGASQSGFSTFMRRTNTRRDRRSGFIIPFLNGSTVVIGSAEGSPVSEDQSLAALQLTEWSNCINDGCTRKADRTTTSRVVVRNQPTRPFPEAVTAANE